MDSMYRYSHTSLALFAYSVFEFAFFRIFQSSKLKCLELIRSAHSSYIVPAHVSNDIMKQLTENISTDTLKRFYLDLFDCQHISQISRDNLVRLFRHTMGLSEIKANIMINQLEKKICFIFPQFEIPLSPALQHAFSRDDDIIRGCYLPCIFKLPIVVIKLFFDTSMHHYYQYSIMNSSTDHIIFWYKQCFPPTLKLSDSNHKKVLFFICGIGIGPFTYRCLLDKISQIGEYDLLIVSELKWLSYHLTTDPVRDKVIIESIVVSLKPIFSNDNTVDLMAHSGGALYFKRLNELLPFRNKFLVEPACFLAGCTTGTRQIYTLDTWHPLFQDPFIKNLSKILDITETVLLTQCRLENCYFIFSQNDTMFNPDVILEFLNKYHKHVNAYVIKDSAHGDAVSKYYSETVDIVRQILHNNKIGRRYDV